MLVREYEFADLHLLDGNKTSGRCDQSACDETRKSSTDEVGDFGLVIDGLDVLVLLRVRPVLGQDTSAERLDLAVPDRPRPGRALETQLQSTDAGEKGADGLGQEHSPVYAAEISSKSVRG